jgi:hypothetical protein
MTGPADESGGTIDPRSSAADRWISGGTVAGLAGIAGAISYSHMRQLAVDHGQAGWHAHAFPLSVDGIEIVASLVLFADRRARRRSGWLPWAALARPEAWPRTSRPQAPASSAGSSRAGRPWRCCSRSSYCPACSTAPPRPAPPRPVPARHPARLRTRARARLRSDPYPGPFTSRSSGIASPAKAAVQADRTGDHDGGAMQSAPATGAGTVPGAGDLLSAARTVRDGLLRDGRPLTRDALATRLRQDGHPVRNSRRTPLLHALRSEIPARAPSSALNRPGATRRRTTGRSPRCPTTVA